jgi:ADP-ribosylglycohydrolase
MITRDKVYGFLLGTAIGDALGIPTETFTSAQIREKYPNGLTKYEIPDGHKWYEGQPAGSYSDDTVLTIATMKGLIAAGDFTLESQARAAVEALTEAERAIPEGKEVGGSGVPGWGSSTVEAIRRLANNVHWRDSGKTSIPHRGTGNGAVMRCGPLAAYFATLNKQKVSKICFNQMVCDFSAMTHYTDLSAIATVVHVRTLINCFNQDDPHDYNWRADVSWMLSIYEGQANMLARSTNEYWSYEHLTRHQEDREFWEQLNLAVDDSHRENWDDQRIEEAFGGGSCYVAHSVPFTYAHMARGPLSIQTLYRVAAAGGDTDTNASLVGGMLGALYGAKIFEEEAPHLINDLIGIGKIKVLADEFCDKFKIGKVGK